MQDRVPAFSNREAFAVVESDLGVPFEDVYELVEPECIAAASIGQVNRPGEWPALHAMGDFSCTSEPCRQ